MSRARLKDRFDLVIFDWAGTMVDFGCTAPAAALVEAFRLEGVVLDESAARRDMGKAKSDHVRSLLAEPALAAAWRTFHGRDADERDIAALVGRIGTLLRLHAAGAGALIPGARATFESLRSAGLRVASSTGYTREMMEPVLAQAAEQGYAPEHVVCSGETPFGRPSPLMIYKACADLGVWPLSRVVKVDDAEAGIAEGKAAGAFTVAVASGNALALSLDAFNELAPPVRAARLHGARSALQAARPDLVIDSVADFIPALERAIQP